MVDMPSNQTKPNQTCVKIMGLFMFWECLIFSFPLKEKKVMNCKLFEMFVIWNTYQIRYSNHFLLFRSIILLLWLELFNLPSNSHLDEK